MRKLFFLLTTVCVSLFIMVNAGSVMAAGFSNENVDIKTDNTAKGYIEIKVTKATDKQLRVRITKADKNLTYVLRYNKNYYKFPLQLGSGTYGVKVMENAGGNKYAVLYSTDIPATISDPLAPFTISHSLVNYDAAPKTVAAAKQITAGSASDLDKLEKVYANVVDTMTYDHAFAAKVTSGQVTSYVPDVDAVYASKKGICFDYSAVMASMLRSQGVPTRLVMGYVAPKNIYHAWNEVYITNVGWVKVRGNIAVGSNVWTRMDATFASSGGTSDLSSFIGDGTNYKVTDYY